MKIGYPCINRSIGCTTNSTFRLANFSEEKLINKVDNNLSCLEKILEYNIKQGFLFFRISSDIIPFAGHEINLFDWGKYFKKRLEAIGQYIKENDIRISMHPDQFVLLNSLNPEIIKRSILELKWQVKFLDIMDLDETAKIQIHVGGVYGDKEASIKRFVSSYRKLSISIKKRLVIENDERMYSLKDCLNISKQIGIPILFDYFHHCCLNNNELLFKAIKDVEKTWKKKDGVMMNDYSSQDPFGRLGKHAESIDLNDFGKYLREIKPFDCDIMLEIKDKETSALKALKVINKIKK
jgi:UV DNA damage endonuclease